MELADRQDAIDDWLTAHDVEGVDAEPLARSGFQPADLETISAAVGADKVGVVLAARGHAAGGPAAGVGDRHRRHADSLAGRRGQGVHLCEPAGDAAADRDRAGAVRHHHGAALEGAAEVGGDRSAGPRAAAHRGRLRRRAEPGLGQPGGQRHRRHAGRARPDRSRCRGRCRRRARGRRRARHSCRRGEPHLRPVLHHEGNRAGHRPRASTSPAASCSGTAAPST